MTLKLIRTNPSILILQIQAPSLKRNFNFKKTPKKLQQSNGQFWQKNQIFYVKQHFNEQFLHGQRVSLWTFLLYRDKLWHLFANYRDCYCTLKKTVHIYFFSYFLSLTHTIFKNNKQHEHDTRTCASCNGACIKVYRLTRRQGGALI